MITCFFSTFIYWKMDADQRKRIETQLRLAIKRKSAAKTPRGKLGNMVAANKYCEALGKDHRYSREQIERVENLIATKKLEKIADKAAVRKKVKADAGEKKPRAPRKKKDGEKQYSPFVMQKIAEREAAKKAAE